MAEGSNPKGSGLSNDEWSALDNSAGKSIRKLLDRLKKAEDKIARNDDDLGTIGDIGVDGGFFNTLNQNANQLNKMVTELNRLNKEGLTFARDPAFQRGMKNVTESIDQMLGSAERGAKTYGALFQQLKGFAQMSSVVFDKNAPGGPRVLNQQVRTLSDSLAEQGAILNELGVSLSDFKSNIDSAVYSFGLNKQEVLDFNLQLKDLANNLQMMPSEVSRNFQLVSKNMAYDLGTIKDEFVKIQKLSLGTGVDTQAIVSTFGQRMDTIQGSSGAAASLNQILGGQYFSGNQLLRMTESERANAIRSAFMNNDALMQDIKMGGKSSSFALQSIAESMPGMDIDQVRRFILTGKKDSVKAAVGARAQDQANEATQEKFRSSIENYQEALEKGTKEIYRTFSEFKRAQIEARRMTREQELKTGKPGLVSTMGATALFGPMPGKATAALAARAFGAGAGADDLKRVIQMSQLGLISDDELIEIMKDLASNKESERQRAGEQMRDLTLGSRGESLQDDLKRRFAKLPEPVRGAIDYINQVSPFTARQILRELRPGGLLSGEKASDSDLFKQLQTVGAELSSKSGTTSAYKPTADSFQDLKNQTGGDDSILKGLFNAGSQEKNLQKKMQKGTLDMGSYDDYRKNLGKRSSIIMNLDKDIDKKFINKETIKKAVKDLDIRTPRKRGETPDSTALPGEVTSSRLLGSGERLAVYVNLDTGGQPLDRSKVTMTAELRKLTEGMDRALS